MNYTSLNLFLLFALLFSNIDGASWRIPTRVLARLPQRNSAKDLREKAVKGLGLGLQRTCEDDEPDDLVAEARFWHNPVSPEPDVKVPEIFVCLGLNDLSLYSYEKAEELIKDGQVPFWGGLCFEDVCIVMGSAHDEKYVELMKKLRKHEYHYLKSNPDYAKKYFPNGFEQLYSDEAKKPRSFSSSDVVTSICIDASTGSSSSDSCD